MGTDPVIHPTAVVEDGALIGARTRVWHQSHVRAGSRIGEDCNLGLAVYVDEGVRIGDRCRLANHVSVFRGVTIEDEVFVGPSVTFTNDRYPRAGSVEWDLVPTVVRRGASIGANATIVCGADLGEWCMVAAGSVVTGRVPPHALIVGIPGSPRGWVCRCGRPLPREHGRDSMSCAACGRSLVGVGVGV